MFEDSNACLRSQTQASAVYRAVSAMTFVLRMQIRQIDSTYLDVFDGAWNR
jgi:hypothetical protein